MKITGAKNFGKAIQQQRKRMGYTQVYLAEVTGFSTSFISDLENGKPTAELEKALFLANLLGLDVEIYLDDAAEELFQMGFKDIFSVRDSIKEQIYKNE